jgi:hypothetical protein
LQKKELGHECAAPAVEHATHSIDATCSMRHATDEHRCNTAAALRRLHDPLRRLMQGLEPYIDQCSGAL